MSYIAKKFFISEPRFAFRFLMDTFEIKMGEAQKMIDRKCVYVEDELLVSKGSKISGNISVIVFEGNSRGLKPVFETEDFAVFDKPSGVMIHPKNREDEYTLNDEIKSLFGKNANCAHRIDKSTSGLVLVCKNKPAEISLKALFANRNIHKKYLALVEGKVESEIFIDEKLKRDISTSDVRLKVHVDSSGKVSQTNIMPLEYFEDINATFVEATPLTGRQHQIRVHLFHVKHKIIGDPIYGISESDAIKFLDGKMCEEERLIKTGAQRLLLHAQSLEFMYKDINYKIESKIDAKKVFYNFYAKKGKNENSYS